MQQRLKCRSSDGWAVVVVTLEYLAQHAERRVRCLALDRRNVLSADLAEALDNRGAKLFKTLMPGDGRGGRYSAF